MYLSSVYVHNTHEHSAWTDVAMVSREKERNRLVLRGVRVIGVDLSPGYGCSSILVHLME